MKHLELSRSSVKIGNMKLIFTKVSLPIMVLKEGETFIAYSPALDLSSCGKTQASAIKNFRSAVKVFLQECEEMNTLDDVLCELGWTKKQHAWEPPKIIQQTQIEMPLALPA